MVQGPLIKYNSASVVQLIQEKMPVLGVVPILIALLVLMLQHVSPDLAHSSHIVPRQGSVQSGAYP